MLIKIVLLAGLGVLGYLFLFRTRALLFQRLVGTLLGLILCVFIIVPQLSMQTAHFFGVGRGADFVFYLAHLFLFYMLLKNYLRVQKLEAQITELARQIAIGTAVRPDDGSSEATRTERKNENKGRETPRRTSPET